MYDREDSASPRGIVYALLANNGSQGRRAASGARLKPNVGRHKVRYLGLALFASVMWVIILIAAVAQLFAIGAVIARGRRW